MITTDNSANVAKVIVNELELPYFSCEGHMLRLKIGKAFRLGQVDRILGKVKSSSLLEIQ